MQKRKVLSLEWKSEGVMDDESGESIELMEEMPLKELGEAELERLDLEQPLGLAKQSLTLNICSQLMN